MSDDAASSGPMKAARALGSTWTGPGGQAMQGGALMAIIALGWTARGHMDEIQAGQRQNHAAIAELRGDVSELRSDVAELRGVPIEDETARRDLAKLAQGVENHIERRKAHR